MACETHGHLAMRTLLTTAVLCLTLWSAQASAQSWREAYDAGDYARAAAILQPMIVEPISETGATPDASATELLADMYALGQGVGRDPMMACALLTHAERGASAEDVDSNLASAARYRDNLARLAKRREEQCGRLTHAERIESIRLLGCPTNAFPTHTFQLSATHSVAVDRQGIRVRHNDVERSDELTLFACPLDVAQVRYSRVEPPAGSSSPARHFLELFTWSAMSSDEGPQVALVWHVREIVGSELEPRAMEFLERAHQTWPRSLWSPAVTHVDLVMDRLGNVRWQFAANGGPAGVFEHLPSARSRHARSQPRRD
jgi:hypothetical protein